MKLKETSHQLAIDLKQKVTITSDFVQVEIPQFSRSPELNWTPRESLESSHQLPEDLQFSTAQFANGWSDDASHRELQQVCHQVEQHLRPADDDRLSEPLKLDEAFIQHSEMT